VSDDHDWNPIEPTSGRMPELTAAVTVAELNQSIARLFARQYPYVRVVGEISNLTRAASGHWYFTLKDKAAQIRAVMFRMRAQLVDFIPREGDQIEVRGKLTLYEPRGDLQLSIDSMRRAGTGDLLEAFLRLKEKLAALGLFDSERKRPIPREISRIGIVTSPQAAALRDVLTTLRMRAPHLQVTVYPTVVQGAEAAGKIIAQLERANARAEVDVILLIRGGGSIEDLWAFNDEALAHVIARSKIPIVSGVGHETDFTIADFVADLRAATPTAAAVAVSIDRRDQIAQMERVQGSLARSMRRRIEATGQRIDMNAKLLRSPRAAWLERVNALNTNALALRASMRQRIERADTRLNANELALNLISPSAVLQRGYAIVQTLDGVAVRDAGGLEVDQVLTARFAHGSASLRVDRSGNAELN
jgi:exodeoxyribonuclease VII large subunit